MGKNTSVALSDHFVAFVDKQVETGRYASASEVVRAGLRMLEEYETDLHALQAALVEGEQSGDALAFDFDEFIARMHAEQGAS